MAKYLVYSVVSIIDRWIHNGLSVIDNGHTVGYTYLVTHMGGIRLCLQCAAQRYGSPAIFSMQHFNQMKPPKHSPAIFAYSTSTPSHKSLRAAHPKAIDNNQKSGEVCGMAAMLASAVATAAGNKLGGAVAEEFWSLWNLRKDLKSMKDTLESIQARLKDAERKSMAKNESATLWLRRLKSAAYDIQDMLDDYRTLNPREEAGDGVKGDDNSCGKVSLFCSSLSPSHIRVAHKIKKMKQRLQEIHDQAGISGLDFFRDADFHEDEGISTRDTTSDISEDIVGRETDKEKIISSLLAESRDHITVTAIHGFGGLGKTTLAKLAFNDVTVAKYFDLRVWVRVPMKYDLKKIGESILSQVDKPAISTSYHTLEPLKQDLKTKLGDRKLLIVLDDLWEEDDEELGRLMDFLKACAEGCSVMVTTRKEQIATKMQPVLSHRLEALSKEQSWDLFKQKAFSHGQAVPAEVEKIGRELAQMCGGVPLAIKSLGSTMRSKKGVAAWKDMRDSDIWKMEGEVLPSLILSFYNLPARLKLCFAYCSVLPKGCEIDKDLLIQQWIAMEFIQSTNKTLVLEKLGEEYVRELMGMSFLEYSRMPFSVASKHITTPRLLQMHDLIHDLAIAVAGEDFLFSDFVDKDIADSRKNAHRYAVLANCSDASTISKNVSSKTRSLHFRDCKQLPKNAFPLSKFLRVLDLSGCSIVELPGYITHRLKLLKFLDASDLQSLVPPEQLSSLRNLHALNLSYSSLRSLPTHIGNLYKLRYLNLHNCSHLSQLPESFVQLKDLLHLDLSMCSSLENLPASFGNLHKLSFLDLSDCVNLSMLPESFAHLVKLEELILSGSSGSWGESIRCLTSLESLEMRRCTVEEGEWLRDLKSLRGLLINECSLPLDFAQHILYLSTLEALELVDCWEAIKVLSEGEVQALIRQIPNVTVFSCGHVQEAIWKNNMLTYSSFRKINKKWVSEDYNEAGVWPTILPEWRKGPEDDHNGTGDEAGPSIPITHNRPSN